MGFHPQWCNPARASRQITLAEPETDSSLRGSCAVGSNPPHQTLIEGKESRHVKDECEVQPRSVGVRAKKSRPQKKQLEQYKDEGESKWQEFKTNFSHDMDAVGKTMADLFKDNG